jgi:hypothetical protein
VLILTNPLLLLLLLAPDVIRLPILERGNEGGHGSVWGGVHLVMGVIIFWTPIESHPVHHTDTHINILFNSHFNDMREKTGLNPEYPVGLL